MGLDQYFYVRKNEGKEKKEIEIAYLRKANALQRYFESVHDLGNCKYIEIDDDILNDLEERLNGTDEIVSKFIKDKKLLALINAGEDYDLYEKIANNFDKYVEEQDAMEEEIMQAYLSGKAFYPGTGFFYGEVSLEDFILWQLPQMRKAIKAVSSKYDDLEDNESILYYSWW